LQHGLAFESFKKILSKDEFLRQCWPIGEVSYRFESIQAHVWEKALFPITSLKKFKKHERVI
jgi:hypothetical protein